MLACDKRRWTHGDCSTRASTSVGLYHQSKWLLDSECSRNEGLSNSSQIVNQKSSTELQVLFLLCFFNFLSNRAKSDIFRKSTKLKLFPVLHFKTSLNQALLENARHIFCTSFSLTLVLVLGQLTLINQFRIFVPHGDTNNRLIQKSNIINLFL